MFHQLQISSSEKILYKKLDYNRYNQLTEFLRLHKVDLSQLENLSNLNRKIEWMSVREMVIHEMPEEDILYNANRKPFLKFCKHFISISHSTNMVAIGINRRSNIGIDIQQITDKISRIKSKFLDKRELSLCANNPTELTCYWAVKEALFKLYGIQNAFLKENMKVLELNFNGAKGSAIGQFNVGNLNSTYSFLLRKLDNHILAFSVNT